MAWLLLAHQMHSSLVNLGIKALLRQAVFTLQYLQCSSPERYQYVVLVWDRWPGIAQELMRSQLHDIH